MIYAIAVVGAPFFEELYFRGLVQSTLTARWGFVVGIGVQALLFGLVHLDPENGWGNVGVFVMITLVGTMLGTIRHYTKRLAARDVHARDVQRDHRDGLAAREVALRGAVAQEQLRRARSGGTTGGELS